MTATQETRQATVFEFSEGVEPWSSIDDTVMGGRSGSRMWIEDRRAVFSGDVSLANGGGFASIRSRPADRNLSGYRGVALRVRGDGKSYGLRIKTDWSFDGVNYQAPLEPGEGEWVELRIPFDEFLPVFRGRAVHGHPPLDPGSIKSFGLIVSGRQSGSFRLELDWIRAYGD